MLQRCDELTLVAHLLNQGDRSRNMLGILHSLEPLESPGISATYRPEVLLPYVDTKGDTHTHISTYKPVPVDIIDVCRMVCSADHGDDLSNK
jgi:hypothetical protein